MDPYSTAKAYHLYSAVGHFLGPALTDRPVNVSVQSLRDTRTFATRLVTLSQTLDSGEDRRCMTMLADFQTQEDSMPNMIYSQPPFRKYSSVSASRSPEELRKLLVSEGKLDEKIANFDRYTFRLGESLLESRLCPEGIFGQNLRGVASHVQHTQENVPLEQRTSGDWLRCRQPLSTQAEQLSALAFAMDGAVSFNPLSHDHMFVQDAGANSSLDFALRVFVNEVDFNAWSLRELRTITGGEGRTYSEGRLWDQSGKMVASMTQQCIMRPKKAKI